MKKWFGIVLTFTLLLSGCSAPSDADTSSDATDKQTGSTVAVDFAQNDADMFTDRDGRTAYDENASVAIQLNGNTASCESSAVKISGSTVTITDEGTYVLSGTLNNGMIVVDADDADKLQLVLKGVSVTSATSAALYVREADKVFVTLADGTKNTLANGGVFTAVDENAIDAAVFSKQDLTFNGTGSLVVTSPAGHGIVSKDDLVLTGGTYTVTCASHGLDANDSIRIKDITATVDAGKDGIHAENNDDTVLGFVYISSGTLTVEAEGDGISAGAYLQIQDGTIAVTAGGGSVNSTKESSDHWGGFVGGGMGGGRPGRGMRSSTDQDTADESSTSMKALKSTGEMLISGGTFTIDSADDAVHSNASVTVNGGAFTVATGDDGFHADETLTVVAGTITVTESYEGLEALDIVVSGGAITLTADDDGLNAAGGTDASGTTGGRDAMFGGGRGGMGGMGGASSNGSIVISGGTLAVTASGDGIDANGTLAISGGYTTVCGPTQGDTATLDYDKSAVITGGTFIGTGASGMAQTFSDSEQGVIAVSVGNQSAGTEIVLKDSAGNTVLKHTPELSFAVAILSSPDMEKGKSYTVTVGSDSGTFEAA